MIYETLKTLLAPVGISGKEGRAAKACRTLFDEICDRTEIDRAGNVIGYIGSHADAPTVMLEAHIDEIGLMVSGITEEGSVQFKTVGGFDYKIFPGSEVTIHGKEKLFGVIGAVPPHLSGNQKNTLDPDKMCIDTGLSAEEVKKSVKVGDFISFNEEIGRLQNDFIYGRCLDDRSGIAAIYHAAKEAKGSAKCNMILLAAVREEIRSSGAQTVAARLMPDCAIAVDVTHGITHDNSDEAFECGKGAVVSIGPNLHPKLTNLIFGAAKALELEVAVEVDSGPTGTDAWGIQVAGEGIPCALVSLPQRYMHTNREVMSLSDIEAASHIMARFLCDFKDGDALCY